MDAAAGKGNVTLNMNLNEGKRETCTLHDVLYVSDLAYNLLSITSAGKVAIFTNVGCEIRNFKSKLIASGYWEGNLYYLCINVHFIEPIQASTTRIRGKFCGLGIWGQRL